MKLKRFGVLLLSCMLMAAVSCGGEEEETYYNVTFNLNYNDNEILKTEQVKENELVTKPTDPTRQDFTFGGWYKDSYATVEFDFATEKITSDLTLYAGWTPDASKWSVYFDLNYDGAPQGETKVVSDGETIASYPSDPERTGWEFKGWYKEKAATTKWQTTDVVTGNLTLYAGWQVLRHTVTFHLNDGTDGIHVTRDVNHGGTVNKPNDPDRIGYGFEGWYKEAACSNVWDFGAHTVNDDMGLYAKWIARVGHTVSLNFNYVGAPENQTFTVYDGDLIILPTLIVEREGYDIVGWYEDAEFANQWEFDMDTVSKDTELFAKWSKQMANGIYILLNDAWAASDFGTLKIWNGSENVDGVATVIPNEYFFAGAPTNWITIKDNKNANMYNIPNTGYGTTWNRIIVLDAAGVSFNGQAIEDTHFRYDLRDPNLDDVDIFQVVFDLNYPDAPEYVTKEVADGSKVTAPAVPTRDGNQFKEWCEDKAGAEPFSFDTPIEDNLTLYASWTENTTLTEVTVIFDFNYTGAPEPVEITGYVGLIIDPEETPSPTREGYEFAGWFEDAACTDPWIASYLLEMDVTLYAKWTKEVGMYVVISDNWATANIQRLQVWNGVSNVWGTRTVFDKEFFIKGTPTSNIAIKGFEGEDGNQKANLYSISPAGIFGVDWNRITILEATSPTVNQAGVLNTHYTLDYRNPNMEDLDQYELVFDLNYVDAPDYIRETLYEGEDILAPADPTRAGYIFNGWYEEATCENAFTFGVGISGDTTLYASWIDITTLEEVTITFDFNYVGSPAAVEVDGYVGMPLAEPVSPTRDGYKFDGWYREASCVTPWLFASDLLWNDITLYAKWTENAVVGVYIQTPNSWSSYNNLEIVLNAGGTTTNGRTPVVDGVAFIAGSPGYNMNIQVYYDGAWKGQFNNVPYANFNVTWNCVVIAEGTVIANPIDNSNLSFIMR